MNVFERTFVYLWCFLMCLEYISMYFNVSEFVY
jgi:hypothetical protein